jgi:hypothetical protein
MITSPSESSFASAAGSTSLPFIPAPLEPAIIDTFPFPFPLILPLPLLLKPGTGVAGFEVDVEFDADLGLRRFPSPWF